MSYEIETRRYTRVELKSWRDLMIYGECVIQGDVKSEHFAQLFDGPESLADVVANFVYEGLAQGDSVLLVISLEHWELTARRLSKKGVQLDSAMADGRLTVRDAGTTLARLMRRGSPDPHLFEQTVCSLVRQVRARGRRLRVYGEMVDLLAVEGNLPAAQQLEDLWNRFMEEESFTLFCGYSAVNFGDPAASQALNGICRSHSHMRAYPRDILGFYLLQLRQARAS